MLRFVSLRTVATAILLTVLAGSAIAQDFFSVRNQKKEKWPQTEANRIYMLASEAVEREFKLSRPVRPKFTLVLGWDGNQLDVNSGELRLAKWDRRIFADGVILFCMEQMLTPEMRLQLLRRTLLAADVVDADEKVGRSEHASETMDVAASPAAHAGDKQ